MLIVGASNEVVKLLMGNGLPSNQDGLRRSPSAGVQSFEFTTVVGLFPNHCGARFCELTGKMERLVDKFYFDTSSLGELRDEPLWDELLLG